jgi:mono/diheme cytochrome c family protein
MAPLRRLPVLLLALLALIAVGCGTENVELPEADTRGAAGQRIIRGATLFDQRCAACHTLNVAGAQGSSVDINQREYKDGPNFNERKEGYNDVLYAIRNGGFSSGPMPQNIVTGEDAEAVAQFVAKYAGNQAEREPVPGTTQPPGTEETNAPEQTQ